MSYGIQSGCRVECGYKTLQDAIEAVKGELTQYCRPLDRRYTRWEDPVTGRFLRIVWMDDI